MKNIKKNIIIASLLSFVLVLPGVFNVASANTSRKVTIDYWLWQDNATDPTWLELAKQFNSTNPRIEVKLQIIPLAQFQDKLATSLVSGNGPDAARFKDSWLGAYVKNRLAEPLSAKINAWGRGGNVNPSAYEAGRVPGNSEVFMLPHQNTALYMYFNKAIFKKNGLSAPKTQDDVLAAARVLDANKQYALDIRGGAGGQDQWAAWMLAGGARFTDQAGEIVIANQKAITVNQKYLDLNKFAPPGSSTASFAQVKANFLSGTSAMMIHHAGSLVEMRTKWGDDLGVIPMPSENPKSPATIQAMSGNIVLAASKKQDAAFKWITWLLSPVPMMKLSMSPQGQLAVTKTESAKQGKGTDPGYKVALVAARTAESWPRLVGTTAVTSATWAPTLQEAFAGKSTSAEALKKIAEGLGQK
jgi:multiple sugar transport system substrate-binding protein